MPWTAAPTSRRRLTDAARSDLPCLSEIFCDTSWDGAAPGFVLSRLPQKGGPVLWVQDRVSRKESGVPYLPGLGDLDLMLVAVNRPLDALWAMEEGLYCGSLRAVIGEIWGSPPALSFTATKRLALRAEASGVPCLMMRRGAAPDLSAARDRWRLNSLPSARLADDPQAPGAPRWQAELFRSRSRAPGQWVIGDEAPTDRVDRPAGLPDGALDARDGGPARRAAG